MVRDGKEREQNEMANGVIVEEFMKNHQPKPRTRPHIFHHKNNKPSYKKNGESKSTLIIYWSSMEIISMGDIMNKKIFIKSKTHQPRLINCKLCLKIFSKHNKQIWRTKQMLTSKGKNDSSTTKWTNKYVEYLQNNSNSARGLRSIRDLEDGIVHVWIKWLICRIKFFHTKLFEYL